ncbi:MAG: hypothetical protein [Microviridae sp.]|nr:MAG: hypothetical protein [Microviridae sp.]
MNNSDWLSNLNLETVLSLLCFIGAFIFGIVNFFRTGRLNNSAKNFIKGEVEELKTRPNRVAVQTFSEERTDYILNKATNLLEESPLKVNVQKEIQSHVESCLEFVLEALNNPESYVKDGDNVKVVDSVAERNAMNEDLAYAGDIFDMAEEYRERFGLSADMSVQDIFAHVKKYSEDMSKRLQEQGKTIESEVN